MAPSVLWRNELQAGIKTAPVKTTTSLTQQDLIDLVQGRFFALRVTNYYPNWLCDQLCIKLLKLPEFSRYIRSQNVGVQRTGITFFETKEDPELLARYYEQAQRMSSTLRHTCFPYLSPIDKLRVELEEVWSAGARLENIHGRPMMVGIARMFEDCFDLPPHQDVLARDTSENLIAGILHSQISANIYLREAKFGGELEVWGLKPSDAEFIAHRCDELHYDRNQLPPPEVIYKPRAGDLVLFDSSRIHGVRPSIQGPRISMSCFIGYRGVDKPLTYWS